MRWLATRCVDLCASYGVRESRIGALRRSLLHHDDVKSFTPSRIGTIASRRTKSADGQGLFVLVDDVRRHRRDAGRSLGGCRTAPGKQSADEHGNQARE